MVPWNSNIMLRFLLWVLHQINGPLTLKKKVTLREVWTGQVGP